MVKTKAGSLACLMALSEKLHPITEQNAWHRERHENFRMSEWSELHSSSRQPDTFCSLACHQDLSPSLHRLPLFPPHVLGTPHSLRCNSWRATTAFSTLWILHTYDFKADCAPEQGAADSFCTRPISKCNISGFVGCPVSAVPPQPRQSSHRQY